MLGAPLWARALTVAAGPVFNFVLSAAIFCLIFLGEGQPADPVRVEKIEPLPFEVALAQGDQILEINGQPANSLDDLASAIAELEVAPEVSILVERDGQELALTEGWLYPPLASSITPGSAASDVDLKAGDVILSVDGDPVFAFAQLIEKVTASNGEVMILEVWREGEILEFAVSPRRSDILAPDGGFETRWLIGITGGLMFDLVTETPGVFESLWMGVRQVGFIIESSLSGLWHMITGAISSCNLSGPIGIAETSGEMASQGGTSFIWFVAVLSTAVGMLNLFPIPVLDGGHLVFHAYEAIARRPPSDRALRILMSIGLALLGTLMIFAIANDLFLCP